MLPLIHERQCDVVKFIFLKNIHHPLSVADCKLHSILQHFTVLYSKDLNKSVCNKCILLLGLSLNQIFIYVGFILLKNEIIQR